MDIYDKFLSVTLSIMWGSIILNFALFLKEKGYGIMEITALVTVAGALIGLLATLITLLVKVRRDSKTLDEIKTNTSGSLLSLEKNKINSQRTFENTKNSQQTFVNTEEIKKAVIGDVKPAMLKLDQLDFVADEIRFQKRIKESISSELQNADSVIQQINLLYEKNSALLALAEKYSNECLALVSEKIKLKDEIEKLQAENKRLRSQIEHEHSAPEIDF